ncbi:VOC family protein [Micromonospora sp. NPDC000089]|uniref:VOC family protein n=1 Tax=unclassified Micromonospora TaxID=2617518 RepID=UPI00368422C8
MGDPVVHFEIIGSDPERLRGYYGALFGWEFDVGGPVAESVSAQGEYGHTRSAGEDGGPGLVGGVGGGAGHRPHVLFYVGVPDVGAALRRAEELGGSPVTGPERVAGRDLVVARFTDPEGNLVGLAGQR